MASGNLPTVELVRLPNDHTAGTRPGSPTPKAYVADDYALGRLADAVSHSPYWPSTAIFVVEDDAQNGPDHVDAHRTIAQVISPYQAGKVDSTFYSTVSMLRTMELLVGLRPMTQFDAAATPMFDAFTTRPDTTPSEVHRPAGDVLKAVNGPRAAVAGAPVSQDLSQEDRIDEQSFNLDSRSGKASRGARPHARAAAPRDPRWPIARRLSGQAGLPLQREARACWLGPTSVNWLQPADVQTW